MVTRVIRIVRFLMVTRVIRRIGVQGGYEGIKVSRLREFRV